jgi:hypothetical protein
MPELIVSFLKSTLRRSVFFLTLPVTVALSLFMGFLGSPDHVCVSFSAALRAAVGRSVALPAAGAILRLIGADYVAAVVAALPSSTG